MDEQAIENVQTRSHREQHTRERRTESTLTNRETQKADGDDDVAYIDDRAVGCRVGLVDTLQGGHVRARHRGDPVVAKGDVVLVEARQEINLLLLGRIRCAQRAQRPMGVRAIAVLVRALERGRRAAANVRLAGTNRGMQREIHRGRDSRRRVHYFQRAAELLAEGSVGPESVVPHGLGGARAVWQADRHRNQQRDLHPP